MFLHQQKSQFAILQTFVFWTLYELR
jgi:hypothetical protein